MPRGIEQIDKGIGGGGLLQYPGLQGVLEALRPSEGGSGLERMGGVQRPQRQSPMVMSIL